MICVWLEQQLESLFFVKNINWLVFYKINSWRPDMLNNKQLQRKIWRQTRCILLQSRYSKGIENADWNRPQGMCPAWLQGTLSTGEEALLQPLPPCYLHRGNIQQVNHAKNTNAFDFINVLFPVSWNWSSLQWPVMKLYKHSKIRSTQPTVYESNKALEKICYLAHWSSFRLPL